MRGGAVMEESTARSTADTLTEKVRHPVNQLGPVDPGPVPRLHRLQHGFAAKRVRVGLAELRADVGIPRGPEHECWAAQLGQERPGALELLRRRLAVEPQDGALGAVIEFVPGTVGELGRQ